MNITFRRVLVLSPHTDDGELGAGATIVKLIENGSEVHHIAFSASEDSVLSSYPKDILRHESKSASVCLGINEKNFKVLKYQVRRFNEVRQDILEYLIQIRNNMDFDLIMIPTLKDIHQDHKVIADEATRAFKRTTIWGYEHVWNNFTLDSNIFVKVSRKELGKKIQALSCYESQGYRDYMKEDFIYSQARVRGMQIGCEFAESFVMSRGIVD